MSKKIKDVTRIGMVAKLNVNGVVSANGASSSKERKNHIEAKKDRNGRDCTSANCLRHYMFINEMPNQPTREGLSENLVHLAGSVYGQIRGYLDASGGGYKKDGALSVVDAWTDDETFQKPTFSQHTVSKPKEKFEDSKDTSMFSVDLYGPRKQDFQMSVNIRQLQRSVLEGQGSCIGPKLVDTFVENMGSSLKGHGAPGSLKLVKSIESKAIMATPVKSVLYTDDQVSAMVKVAMEKALSLQITKARASLSLDQSSVKIHVYTSNDLTPIEMSLSDFENAMKNNELEFKQFYKEVA